ncbi:hypothetical protein EON78_04690 [bacterium]|nr:MAG: hypothetical protein EON78_04690 [bacterium]
MNTYKVTYGIVMPYDKFCDYTTYQCKLKISTDCGLIETFSTPYTDDEDLTPDGYKQQYVLIPVNGYTGYIRFAQFDVLGDPVCHDPSLGTSPKYIVEYKLSSSSTWIPLASPLLWNGVAWVSSVSPGTYDYRYKGLIASSPDRYAPYYRHVYGEIFVY